MRQSDLGCHLAFTCSLFQHPALRKHHQIRQQVLGGNCFFWRGLQARTCTNHYTKAGRLKRLCVCHAGGSNHYAKAGKLKRLCVGHAGGSNHCAKVGEAKTLHCKQSPRLVPLAHTPPCHVGQQSVMLGYSVDLQQHQ